VQKLLEHNLEEILDNTIETLESSKKDIFSIVESSRLEMDNIKNEIKLVNNKINKIIDEIDQLEKSNRKSRIKLMEVSRDFNKYSEAKIKEVYERAENTSIEIAVKQEKEEQLKTRRSELEKRLINIKNTFDNAKNLVSKVGVARDYLHGQLSDLSEQFDDLQQKQNLAIKIIEAQEEERKRVAREIHDGPAQSIANLVFRVEFAQQMIDKDIEGAKDELESLKGIVRNSVKDVRKIIYDLRPMSLDDLGLIPTLKRYIDRFEDEINIMVNLNILGNKKRLPSSHEITIFRLVQEALNNIHKHAEATQCDIRFEFTPKQINLLIIDNGKGFNLDEVEEGKFGLINMRERCDLIDGEINIQSGDNSGTRLHIKIPIDKK
jgi:two-component system sensor histidine kinase DegS